METTFQKKQKTVPVNLEMMPDIGVFLQEDPLISKKRQYYETLANELMLLKVKTLDRDVAQLENRISGIEHSQHILERQNYDTLFTHVVETPKLNVEKDTYRDGKSTLNECVTIVDRAIEILTEWGKTQDIKLQIQYAAVIVGKIENVKKKEFIQENEVRKKVCTLLRTVIRLNVTDTVFTEEQLLLLKKGFSLLVSDNLQKEDMLQLGRDFRRKHLMTIPVWE